MNRLKYPQDKYPDVDVLERYFMLKLLNDKNVQQTYVPSLLPQIFFDRKKRLVAFVMKFLYEKNKQINPEMIVTAIKLGGEEIILFRKKHYIPSIIDDDVYDMASDIQADNKEDLVDVVYKQLLKAAFSRFVADSLFDLEEANEKRNEKFIIAKCRGIIKVNDILHGRDNVSRDDQLKETMDLINKDDEYVRTCSTVLNSFMGGFTKGYVATIGAKSGHTKSSFTDANIVHNILTKKVNKVLIISPEESAQVRWRRIFAMICKIPTSKMRQKEVKITKENIAHVKDLLWDKLIIEDKVFKMNDIIKLMENSDADMFYVDHLQSITYPGNGSAMMNMIGNIPGMLNMEKRIAKEKNVPIVNLSQVNDKDIQRSDRLIKAPRYWDLYGSSVLYQAAREMIMLHYPWKDYEDNPMIYGSGEPPSINRVNLSLEKSSFSRTGKVPLDFDPDFNIFKDANPDVLKKSSYVAPTEMDMNQLSLLEEA